MSGVICDPTPDVVCKVVGGHVLDELRREVIQTRFTRELAGARKDDDLLL